MLSGPEYHEERQRIECDTLDQIAARGFALRLTCKKCGRVIIVEPTPLLRLAFLKRWNRSRWAIGQHIRCSQCNTNWPEVTPVTAIPTHPAIGITSEEEFERMKRRLRG